MLLVKSSAAAMLFALFCTRFAFASLDGHQRADLIEVPEQNFTVTFTQSVDPAESSARIFGPSGEVPIMSPRSGESPDELVVPVRQWLEPGVYIIWFNVGSPDGRFFSGTTTVSIPSSVPTGSSKPEPTAADAYQER
ncbi:copper resistance protein CopC [Rhizobium sp. S152]|uniref:copper resistance protein CopC n=1 Tax=Rhizobium sp. S152 TaxID=3055038 RepID=UPI0025A996EA|nr:copper resistance protein CopC [Rhizobium sp. S152]MDM9627573.1 copper resistance protein CopC [Rhizobium sp. S152]